MQRRIVGTMAAMALVLTGAGPAPAQHAPSITSSASEVSCRTTFNIERYGAVGDGHKDSADAIQAAVDAAQQAHYGCVYVPSGKFRVGHTVTISSVGSGLKVQGDGQSSRVLATTDADVFRLPNGGNFFTVRDLLIGYVGDATPHQGAAIHTMRGVSNFLFDHLYVDKTAYGLRIDQPEKVGGGTNVIDKSNIHGVQTGVYSNAPINVTNTHIIGGTYGYVIDGQAGGTRMVAVALFGALSLVEDNSINRPGGVDSFYGYDVEANYETPHNAPFPVQGVGSALIIGNNTEFHCVDCWMQDGTVIGSSRAAPSHVTITGGSYNAYPLSHYAGASNQITPHALEIVRAARTIVTGGDYAANGGDAIHLGPQSGSNVVYANHVMGHPVNGIFVGPSRAQNVQYNTIENWARSPIATAERMEATSNVSGNVTGRP